MAAPMLRQLLGRARGTARRVARQTAAPLRRAALRRRRRLVVHLGCGDERLDGFVNIDFRPTAATDVLMNLAAPSFARGSVQLAFSNAFFEHLYRDARTPHLRRIHDALQADGVCCYIGIPYFPNVARCYLERAPGTLGDRFDLYNVYRYTHGDPEHVQGWWLGQLHKSLFDEEEIATLLTAAGFPSFVIFCYGYPGDAFEHAVTLGFYATKSPSLPGSLQTACLDFLKRFDGSRVRLSSLQWLGRG